MSGARNHIIIAWRNWYHCIGNTYGTWLPGDERGWRSWRHARHCQGDYKNPPPPQMHAELLRRSKKLLKRQPVLLTFDERLIIARAMGERLIEFGAEVIDIAVTRMHYHVLARFAPVESRGIAMPRLYEKVRLVKAKHAGRWARSAAAAHDRHREEARGLRAARCGISSPRRRLGGQVQGSAD